MPERPGGDPPATRTAHPATGDHVTVACYCVNTDGLDAHGRTGVVTAGPRGYGDFYDVRVPGWGTAPLTAGEIRRAR